MRGVGKVCVRHLSPNHHPIVKDFFTPANHGGTEGTINMSIAATMAKTCTWTGATGRDYTYNVHKLPVSFNNNQYGNSRN